MSRMIRAIGSFLAALIVASITVPAATAPPTWQRPRVSPHEVHDFTVDGCKITLNYGRPSKKNRNIWGALVPWGRWWMPGADEATIITTTEPITLGGAEGLKVPAGEHTLYMLPAEAGSKLIVSNEVGQFHTVYHPNLDLGRVDLAMTKAAAAAEQLTIQADPRAGGGGSLKLIWDDREYSVNFDVAKRASGSGRQR